MTKFITTRDIRLIGRDVAEGSKISVPADLDSDHAARLINLGYIVADETDDDESSPSLASLKLDELKALAATEGIELGEASKKAEIVELIEKARAEKAAGA